MRIPRRLTGLVTAMALAGPLVTACTAGGTSGPPVEIKEAASPYKGSAIPSSIKLPEVTLTDTGGRPYRLREDSKGTYTLLFFGFTHCPDICPTTMADAAAATRELAPADRKKVRVVFVSADPARDTPKVLKSFLDRFDRSFVGLTGDLGRVKAAAKTLGVVLKDPPKPGSAEAKGDYSVAHGPQVLVFGPDGGGRLLYSSSDGPALTHDLKILTREKPAESKIAISGAQVREPSSPDVTAGYLTVTNNGDTEDTLTGITSSVTKDVQMHDMVMKDGAMSMARMPSMPIPARGSVKFEKGGRHLMLMKPGKTRAGDSVELTLTFARAGEVKVFAKVVPVV